MKGRSSKVCKETSDTLTLGTGDEARAARAAFHLQRCDACQQDEQIVAAAREAVLSADDQLDDLTRARVGDKLAASMERAAARAAAPSPWRRRGVQLAAAAAALALVAGLLLWRASRRGVVEAPRQPVVAEHRPGSRVILPRAIMQGSGPWHDPKLVFGQKVDRLEVPAGVALRASLTPRAELTLYGPLALSVKQAAGDRIELQLDSGILIGEYKGSAGSSLVIRSPGAVTEVVGTLFAVEVHEGQSRVSVSRGKVQVQSRGETTAVEGAQSFSSARSSLVVTPASVVALFAKHERLPELARTAAEAPKADRSSQARAAAPAPKSARSVRSKQGRTPKVAAVAPPTPAAAPDEAAPPRAGAQPEAEAQPPSAGPSKSEEQPQTPAPPESASTLYAAAEAALRRRDHVRAGQILAALIKAHPGAALADSARYELALLLLKRGQRSQAFALLRQIKPTARFAGPAHYLRCRIKREQGKRSAAIACYRAFRGAHPASPYVYQALVTLMRLAAAHKDCALVKKVTGEYLSDYDVGKHVEEARRLRARCGE